MTKYNYNIRELKWNQWLAGIIDGKGYLCIKNNQNVCCEIIMPLKDEYLLFQIKQKLGGKLKLRSSNQSIRYRLTSKKRLIELIFRINGHIRNTVRFIQFKKLCYFFNVFYKKANILTKNNAYIAGFFDADGTICITVQKTSHKNSIKPGVFGKLNRLINAQDAHTIQVYITNKHLNNLILFQKAFNFGQIKSFKKNKNNIYIYLVGLKNIPHFIEYIKTYPLRSSKKKRVFLLVKYLKLKNLQAYFAPQKSLIRKAWNNFCHQWYNIKF